MTSDEKLKYAIQLGAQIAALEAQLEEKFQKLREEHERLAGPLRARLAALLDGSEGDGPSDDGPEPPVPEDANDIILNLLRKGPATLSELTKALYGPAFMNDRKCRGRTSARISNIKKDHPTLNKRDGKFYLDLPPPPPLPPSK